MEQGAMKISNSGAGGSSSFDLRDFPIFSGLSTRRIKNIERLCQWRDFDAGKLIVEHGDVSSDIYFLLSGNVHVMNFADSGRVIDFATLNPGDFFGELAAIDGLGRSATVVTSTPCKLAVIGAKDFLSLVTSIPDITLKVLQKMAAVIRLGDERITDLSLLDAEQRVCLELLRMAQPDPAYLDNLIIHPVPTQKLLAQNVGVARETVVRIFSRLSSDGIIKRKDKYLYIKDKPSLELLALLPKG